MHMCRNRDDVPDQVLQDADRATYRTKHQNVDTRQLPDVAEDQRNLKDELPGAAERGELHLEYQPIVAATNRQLTGVEALIRWKHPTHGMVAPSVLIPLAEQSGLIIELGRWVLEQAWADRQHWHPQRAKDLTMSVNVSAHQFMSAGFADTVQTVLDGAPTDPGLLTLEVTESVFVRDSEPALQALNGLNEIGIKLALDDFGTGYSSLGYLMKFPIDTLKIDRTFIANIERDAASHTIVTAVIQLAHDLGMTVVSEGVESVGQQRELTRLGCDCLQGFYFARPMPASNVNALIQHAPNGYTRLPAPTIPTNR